MATFAAPPIPVMCTVLPFLSTHDACRCAAVSKRWLTAVVPALEARAQFLRMLRMPQITATVTVAPVRGQAITHADLVEYSRCAQVPPRPSMSVIALFRCAAVLLGRQDTDPCVAMSTALNQPSAHMCLTGLRPVIVVPDVQVHLERLTKDPLLLFHHFATMPAMARLWHWVSAARKTLPMTRRAVCQRNISVVATAAQVGRTILMRCEVAEEETVEREEREVVATASNRVAARVSA